MESRIKISYLVEINYFLNMEVQRCENDIFITKIKFASKAFKRFKIERCKLISTPFIYNEKLSMEEKDKKNR